MGVVPSQMLFHFLKENPVFGLGNFIQVDTVTFFSFLRVEFVF